MSAFPIEPTIPSEISVELEEQALELISAANRLAASLPQAVQTGVGDLVRSMNCYYSNLIEGHPTLPADIDNALNDRYSDDPRRRDLQVEAVAHIALQKMIDRGEDPKNPPTSKGYIQWLHREFCSQLPVDMLVAKHPKTAEELPVVPGEFRQADVVVGRHVPPNFSEVDDLVSSFGQAYEPHRHRGVASILAVPAAHHRLLWIHPFVDGNGRVARLLSHAMLMRIGLGNPLWSVSRGLARGVDQYKSTLAAADQSRRGDLDGRGNLSQAGLIDFCRFFFTACIDQITFMESLLKPSALGRRVRLYARDEVDAGRLPKGSTEILVEAVTVGEVERGKVQALTGYQERRARQILSNLVQKGLMVSTGPRKPVRLGFPLTVAERWLPSLYV